MKNNFCLKLSLLCTLSSSLLLGTQALYANTETTPPNLSKQIKYPIIIVRESIQADPNLTAAQKLRLTSFFTTQNIYGNANLLSQVAKFSSFNNSSLNSALHQYLLTNLNTSNALSSLAVTSTTQIYQLLAKAPTAKNIQAVTDALTLLSSFETQVNHGAAIQSLLKNNPDAVNNALAILHQLPSQSIMYLGGSIKKNPSKAALTITYVSNLRTTNRFVQAFQQLPSQLQAQLYKQYNLSDTVINSLQAGDIDNVNIDTLPQDLVNSLDTFIKAHPNNINTASSLISFIHYYNQASNNNAQLAQLKTYLIAHPGQTLLLQSLSSSQPATATNALSKAYTFLNSISLQDASSFGKPSASLFNLLKTSKKDAVTLNIASSFAQSPYVGNIIQSASKTMAKLAEDKTLSLDEQNSIIANLINDPSAAILLRAAIAYDQLPDNDKENFEATYPSVKTQLNAALHGNIDPNALAISTNAIKALKLTLTPTEATIQSARNIITSYKLSADQMHTLQSALNRYPDNILLASTINVMNKLSLSDAQKIALANNPNAMLQTVYPATLALQTIENSNALNQNQKNNLSQFLLNNPSYTPLVNAAVLYYQPSNNKANFNAALIKQINTITNTTSATASMIGSPIIDSTTANKIGLKISPLSMGIQQYANIKNQLMNYLNSQLPEAIKRAKLEYDLSFKSYVGTRYQDALTQLKAKIAGVDVLFKSITQFPPKIGQLTSVLNINNLPLPLTQKQNILAQYGQLYAAGQTTSSKDQPLSTQSISNAVDFFTLFSDDPAKALAYAKAEPDAVSFAMYTLYQTGVNPSLYPGFDSFMKRNSAVFNSIIAEDGIPVHHSTWYKFTHDVTAVFSKKGAQHIFSKQIDLYNALKNVFQHNDWRGFEHAGAWEGLLESGAFAASIAAGGPLWLPAALMSASTAKQGFDISQEAIKGNASYFKSSEGLTNTIGFGLTVLPVIGEFTGASEFLADGLSSTVETAQELTDNALNSIKGLSNEAITSLQKALASSEDIAATESEISVELNNISDTATKTKDIASIANAKTEEVFGGFNADFFYTSADRRSAYSQLESAYKNTIETSLQLENTKSFNIDQLNNTFGDIDNAIKNSSDAFGEDNTFINSKATNLKNARAQLINNIANYISTDATADEIESLINNVDIENLIFDTNSNEKNPFNPILYSLQHAANGNPEETATLLANKYFPDINNNQYTENEADLYMSLKKTYRQIINNTLDITDKNSFDIDTFNQTKLDYLQATSHNFNVTEGENTLLNTKKSLLENSYLNYIKTANDYAAFQATPDEIAEIVSKTNLLDENSFFTNLAKSVAKEKMARLNKIIGFAQKLNGLIAASLAEKRTNTGVTTKAIKFTPAGKYLGYYEKLSKALKAITYYTKNENSEISNAIENQINKMDRNITSAKISLGYFIINPNHVNHNIISNNLNHYPRDIAKKLAETLTADSIVSQTKPAQVIGIKGFTAAQAKLITENDQGAAGYAQAFSQFYTSALAAAPHNTNLPFILQERPAIQSYSQATAIKQQYPGFFMATTANQALTKNFTDKQNTKVPQENTRPLNATDNDTKDTSAKTITQQRDNDIPATASEAMLEKH